MDKNYEVLMLEQAIAILREECANCKEKVRNALSVVLGEAEKRIPKEAVCDEEDDEGYYCCPSCGYILEAYDAGKYGNYEPFCPNCGSAVKWS